MDLMSLVDRAWPVLGPVTKLHTAVYRASGGLLGHRIPFGPPMLLLDHVGARSGVRRSTPLVYAADGENLILIASKGGHPKNPAWYHNLRAHPETTVQVGPEHRLVRAREAGPGERDALWRKACAVYPSFEGYQRRTGRAIPVILLEPRG